MNRAERRRQAKLEKSGKKSDVIEQAISNMIDPIVTLLSGKEFDRAEAALNELLAASPQHAEGLHLRGLLLCQTDREADGIASLRRAVDIAPGEALYWNNLAAAYSRTEQWDASIDAARRSVSLDPGYSDPQYILANVLLAQGNLAEGTDELAKLVRLTKDDGKLWYQLARNRVEQERYDDAVEAYERAVELLPTDVAIMRELATLYMNTWRYDAAQKLRKQADQLDPPKNKFDF